MMESNVVNKTSRALGLISGRHEMHARLMQDPGRRLRVGDTFSPVQPGDPAPGGGTYRSGQYAPHVDDLALATFSSAKDAGILPFNVDLFDESGNLSKEKLEEWDPNSEDFTPDFAEDVPKYSSAVIASSMKMIDNNVLDSLNLSVMQAPSSLGEFGKYIIAAKTSSENRRFFGILYVYPDFYKYIDKPIVPKTPKRDSGLSVSSFMTFHAIGHILFSKLNFDGNIHDISSFMESSGWSKKSDYNHKKANYMGKDSTSAWYKKSSHRFLTNLSSYSPLDDFAQSFALYYTSRDYFQKIDEAKFNIIHKIVTEQSVQ